MRPTYISPELFHFFGSSAPLDHERNYALLKKILSTGCIWRSHQKQRLKHLRRPNTPWRSECSRSLIHTNQRSMSLIRITATLNGSGGNWAIFASSQKMPFALWLNARSLSEQTRNFQALRSGCAKPRNDG